jgi:hypothetical protein
VPAYPSRGRSRPPPPQGLCLDKGSDYDAVRDLRAAFGVTAHIARGGKRPKRCSRKRGSGHGGGWWNGRTVGCTGVVGC